VYAVSRWQQALVVGGGECQSKTEWIVRGGVGVGMGIKRGIKAVFFAKFRI
jgi:hypothetical protein